jgi:hypothetical protein|tara:strand:- start:709 stop:960 length:252 start_codon:yes stop_codon:yes gene_type:complete
MSRYNEINIQHFANLVKDLKIDLLTQEEFDNAIEELYMAIFRHNTKGEYVIETMPYDKDNWKVYRPTQTKEEALLLIKGGKHE